MRAIDIKWSVNVLANLLRRMFSSVEMLTTEIGESPIVWEFCDILLKLLSKLGAKTSVILEDNIRIDSFNQTFFKDEQVRSVASPRTVARSPLRRRSQAPAIDSRETLRLWEWPWIWQLPHPFAKPIVAPI
jgi:hypothetical protein